MAMIYNSDLSKELIEGAKIQTGKDNVPNQLAEKVVPVMEVNPKLLRRVNFLDVNSSGTSAAAVTVKAADANNEIFITHLIYHVIKDAACDAATGDFVTACTINGAALNLTRIQNITLTAQDELISMCFVTPIKIDKNTTIRFTMPTFAAGVCRISLSVGGYKVYNANS